MLGKITNINDKYAFISFEDGTTMDIPVSELPQNAGLGENVDIPDKSPKFVNEKLIDFF
jgi:ribosomal protein S1